MEKINVFCLPFAGGNKYSYRSYLEKAPDKLNVIPIELPGRGARMQDALCTDVHCLVDDVFNQIKDQLDQPYVIYGHSMGTLVGYLLAHQIMKHDLPLPCHLFFTGRMGPSAAINEEPRYLLSTPVFKEKLRQLGGIPEQILENEEVFAFFERALRADFQVVDTYQYQVQQKLPIPISVIIGEHEDITIDEAQTWQEETSYPVVVETLPGDHFFIFQHEETILQKLAEKAVETCEVV